jgi:hypothetical protein
MFDRALLDGDAVRGEVLDHLVQRAGRDQAQVRAAGRRAPNVTASMPRTTGVERHGGVDVGRGQHQVVETVDSHGPIVGARPVYSLAVTSGAMAP